MSLVTGRKASNVINIFTCVDLGSNAKNALRYNIELGRWKRLYRQAVAKKDLEKLDRLEKTFKYIGLP